MRRLFIWIFLFWGGAAQLFSSVHFDEIVKVEALPPSAVDEKHLLKVSDVRDTFNEMLQFHVQHHKLTPMLVQRAYKVFLEQFDNG